MENWTDTLTRRQVIAAREALKAEFRIAQHVQARRSDVDGWAWVEVFLTHSCYTVVLGPKGGVKSVVKNLIA